MPRSLLLVAGAALIFLSGLWHGLATERWGKGGQHARLDAIVARLDALPLTLGDWKGQDVATDREQFVQAGCAGWLTRQYVRGPDGAVVSVMLLAGRPGPISVHPPEACYRNLGYAQHAASQRVQPPRLLASLWVATFIPEHSDTLPPLRIFWGWSAGSGWIAPDHPRVVFASESALLKLYLLHHLDSVDAPVASDPSLDLLGELLPVIQRTVFDDDVE
jgi:hypothetical protein